MQKRKSYRKVRGGCLTCKERKVRCTLERPICRNCSRLDRPCEYVNPSSSLTGMDLQSMQVLELELMHHYTAYTYATLTNNSVLRSLWKEIVPRHAFRHRFLLQGLLALAAHHKLHEEERVTDSAVLMDTASFYQQESLSVYIHLLNDITKENCHALFAFSQLIIAISYSRLSLRTYEETDPPDLTIAGIVDIFDLFKGTATVATQASTWLRKGDLAPMMGDILERSLPENINIACNPCVTALLELYNLISYGKDGTNAHTARIRSLQSTIEFLFTLFTKDLESESRVNDIAGLPVWLDPHYLILLKKRDPASLAILAYYGVLLHEISLSCHIDGLGVRIVQVVGNMIGEEWSKHLEWPQGAISVKFRTYNTGNYT